MADPFADVRDILDPVRDMVRPWDPAGSGGPVALYRFYWSNGSLLYVGITSNTYSRFTAHHSGARWWRKASLLTVELFPDRRTALGAELNAIQNEYPLYNLAGVL